LRDPAWWAGIALAVAVAVAAEYVADFLGVTLLGFAKSPVSPIMLAILLGMLIANTLRLSPSLAAGLRFCASTVLRVGIMLLGFRLSLVSAGTSTLFALPFVILAITVGLVVVGLLGRSMGLSRQLSGLIAVGTSICGCTAIVATTPIIKAKEAEASYAVACITIFGIAAMFAYPVLAHALFADTPELAGLFLGTSIHETAQVAGAGLMYQSQYAAPAALDIATVTKLVRNLCMIAVIPLVGILYAAEHSDVGEQPRWWTLVPWFIIGFAAMSALRSVGELAASGERALGVMSPSQWQALVAYLPWAAEQCLLVAMAAVGLTSLFASIRSIGMKPFLLGLFAALLIGGVSLLSIRLFGASLLGLLDAAV
jgi:uncharacterized integral membrane protein (TIGR00698 family)